MCYVFGEQTVKQSITAKIDARNQQSVPVKESFDLANFKIFRKFSNYVFSEIDIDKSGGVDVEELYTGLLLFHLYLSSYLGPAAAKPASRKKVQQVFHMMDVERNGQLDQDEFALALAILSSHLISRIVSILCLTIFLVPILTQHIVEYLSIIRSFVGSLGIMNQILSYFSDSSSLADGSNEVAKDILSSCAENIFGSRNIFLFLFFIVESFITYLMYQYFGFSKTLPYVLTKLALVKNYFFTAIPVSTITAAPRTIVSLTLAYVIIPKVVISLDKKFDVIARRVSVKKLENTIMTKSMVRRADRKFSSERGLTFNEREVVSQDDTCSGSRKED